TNPIASKSGTLSFKIPTTFSGRYLPSHAKTLFAFSWSHASTGRSWTVKPNHNDATFRPPITVSIINTAAMTTTRNRATDVLPLLTFRSVIICYLSILNALVERLCQRRLAIRFQVGQIRQQSVDRFLISFTISWAHQRLDQQVLSRIRPHFLDCFPENRRLRP